MRSRLEHEVLWGGGYLYPLPTYYTSLSLGVPVRKASDSAQMEEA